MDEQRKIERSGILYCVIGAMSWGFSGACSEAFFKYYTVNPSWVTAISMLLAGIILMLWVVLKKDFHVMDIIKDARGILEILAFSLAGLTLCQFAYLNAIRWTNSGTATVLQNLSVVFVALFVCISTKSLPQKRIIICILLALIGVWLISTGGKPGNMELTSKGLFWGLAAGFGAASYSILSNKPVARWGSIPVTGMGMLIGGLVLCFTIQAWNVPTGLDLRAIILLGIIVFIGTIGAFTLFLQGISMVGPVKASLLACLEPLTAATLSAFWLHSSFSVTDIIGFACILITVFLVRD